ncbi:hypothetical protein QYM36_011790 [Artemia franciscana]|uniref:Uncharacterized protein n=1 Tax=Artemia franciscana TaxID=6661 RepID=A0AA88HSI9_ARTSF|nr:hypothetical protein QYM36_011790 [Artemia franciscana]
MEKRIPPERDELLQMVSSRPIQNHLPFTDKEKLDDTTLVLSGHTDGKHRQGVGFLLSSKARRSLIVATPISERRIIICLKGSAANQTKIQVFAPDSSRNDEESESFYLQLQCIVDSVPKKI